MDRIELCIGDEIYHWSYGRMRIVGFFRYENGLPVSVHYSEAKYVSAEFWDEENKENIVSTVPPLPEIPGTGLWLYEDVSRTIEAPAQNQKTFHIEDQGYAFHTTDKGMLLVDPKDVRPSIVSEAEPLGWLYPLKGERFHKSYTWIPALRDIDRMEKQYQSVKAQQQAASSRIEKSLKNLLNEQTEVSSKFVDFFKKLRDDATDDLKRFDEGIRKRKEETESQDELDRQFKTERVPLEQLSAALDAFLGGLEKTAAQNENQQDLNATLMDVKKALLDAKKAKFQNQDEYKQYTETVDREFEQHQGGLEAYLEASKLIQILNDLLKNLNDEQSWKRIQKERPGLYKEQFARYEKDRRALSELSGKENALNQELTVLRNSIKNIDPATQEALKQRLQDPRYVTWDSAPADA